jgi:hypothetical protein
MKQAKVFKRPVVVMMLIGVVLNAVLWLFSLFGFPKHDVAILHYSVDVGIDFIGEGKQIIVLPAIGLLILVGNYILGSAVYKADKSSAWLVWSTAPIIQLILISAFFLIWRANS